MRALDHGHRTQPLIGSMLCREPLAMPIYLTGLLLKCKLWFTVVTLTPVPGFLTKETTSCLYAFYYCTRTHADTGLDDNESMG